MAKKIFTLETVAAKHGDCLLLHWGNADDPRLILIDGGPNGVYNLFLKKRLEQLRQTRGDPLALDLVIVSHVDDDHIRGILDLTERAEELENQGRPVPYQIDGMWFNTFDDIVGNVEVAAFHTGVANSALHNDHRHSGATIASVGQGRKLRDRANRMGLLVNGGDKLVTDGWIWDMGDGLTFQILGPIRQRVEEFQRAWDKEVKKKGWDVRSDGAAVAAYVDKSPWNLASTIILGKLGNKTMLLTGDARGDDILDGLREWGLLTSSSFNVDILKVPHHGSDRNVRTDFFRQVRANHYVISGNGEHKNPDIATLQMIIDARGNANYKVHCTYRNGIKGLGNRLKAFLSGLPASQRAKFVFRPEAALSMKTDLGAKVHD